MTKAKHTTLPWYAEKKDYAWVVGNKPRIGYHDKIAELPQWGDKTGFGGRAEVAANAAFIVKAVNCHYELLEALKEAIDREHDFILRKKWQKVIDKAEGE